VSSDVSASSWAAFDGQSVDGCGHGRPSSARGPTQTVSHNVLVVGMQVVELIALPRSVVIRSGSRSPFSGASATTHASPGAGGPRLNSGLRATSISSGPATSSVSPYRDATYGSVVAPVARAEDRTCGRRIEMPVANGNRIMSTPGPQECVGCGLAVDTCQPRLVHLQLTLQMHRHHESSTKLARTQTS
jgi:hypothetical protein